ncbi:major facilitator superfamily domain-containing protein [Trichoderma sp. SZMC 28014]
MSGISIDAVLRRLTIKGQEIYSELLNAIATNGRRYIPFLELAPRYITNIDVSTIPAGYNGREICHMLEEAGQPKDRYQYIGVNNVDQDGPTPYYNYVHRDGKSLLCFYNFAELDTNGNERMHWSDLMAVCCSRIMSVNGRSDMANIEWIWRISIVNEETKSVIDAIDQRRSPNLMARNRVVDLTSEDDDFFSLLGTIPVKFTLKIFAKLDSKNAQVDEVAVSPILQPSNDTSKYAVAQPNTISRISCVSSIFMVLVGGLALFSDGYNAQVIGYRNPLFAELYPEAFTSTIKTRLSNAFLIGEVFGMLFFGWGIDRLGRRTGIVFVTLFLILGIVLATAAHGNTEIGLFWMMIIGRGVAGFGAGGSAEASDETAFVRRRRGMLVAVATDFAIDLGFVMAGVIVLIVLAAYHQRINDGVWRVSFGLGFILPVGLLFFRLRLINSTQYRKHAMKTNIPYWLVIKRYWKPMLGTSLAWFMYDFVTYPFGIFGSTIIGTLNPNNILVQKLATALFSTAFTCLGH